MCRVDRGQKYALSIKFDIEWTHWSKFVWWLIKMLYWDFSQCQQQPRFCQIIISREILIFKYIALRGFASLIAIKTRSDEEKPALRTFSPLPLIWVRGNFLCSNLSSYLRNMLFWYLAELFWIRLDKRSWTQSMCIAVVSQNFLIGNYFLKLPMNRYHKTKFYVEPKADIIVTLYTLTISRQFFKR